MNKGIFGAVVGVVIVAVVAVGAYFLFFAGGPGGTGGGAGLPAGMTAKQAADSITASANKSGRSMAYGSAETNNGALVMKDVTIVVPNSKDKIKIGELRFNKYDYKNPDLPAFADIEYRNISLGPLLTTPQAKQFMQMAGVDDIVANIRAVYTYDATNKVLDVTNVTINADKLATIKMAMKLGGIDLAKLQEAQKGGNANPAAMLPMLQSLQIYGITFSITDDGVREAILKSAAKQQNSDVDKIKAMALALLAGVKQQPQSKSAIAQEGITAAEAFIKDGGTIELKIAPDAAVAVMSLAPTFMGGPTPEKIDALKKQLNMSIT
ncbi:MAG: hypothetical protein AAF942_09230, partial [Pseudomonadota bacterium]